MDGDGDGGAPAKRAKLSAAATRRALVPAPGGRRRGRLTDLCDDLLARILLYLPIRQAVRTSVLSRRWRGVWALLQTLAFRRCRPNAPVRAARVLDAYAAHAAAHIRFLGVASRQVPAPESTEWLRLAAPLVSGTLIFDNSDGVSWDDLDLELARPEEAMVDRGAFELPCFKKATKIWLDLGLLGLALPPAGVFHALRILHLENFRFQGQFSLSDTMCPSLRKLTICETRGLVGLTLSSKSLVTVKLSGLRDCQRFNIVAQRLNLLDVTACFDDVPKPTVTIAAESLEVLVWEMPYDPESVCLGEMPCLSVLRAPHISRFEWQGSQAYQSCARFLKRFPAVNQLELGMSLDDMDQLPLLMKDITIPDINTLWLLLYAHGHVFGGSVLQLLKKCTGIARLGILLLYEDEVSHNCPPICRCDHEPASWRIEAMRALEEVYIWNFSWVEREVDSVKQLLIRAPMLKKVRITSKVTSTPSPLVEDIESLCPAGCKLELELELIGYDARMRRYFSFD